MSGVEAAGLVLAAFPLLISALEHYRESAEVLKDWWRYKREYRKVKVEQIPFLRQPLGRAWLPEERHRMEVSVFTHLEADNNIGRDLLPSSGL